MISGTSSNLALAETSIGLLNAGMATLVDNQIHGVRSSIPCCAEEAIGLANISVATLRFGDVSGSRDTLAEDPFGIVNFGRLWVEYSDILGGSTEEFLGNAVGILMEGEESYGPSEATISNSNVEGGQGERAYGVALEEMVEASFDNNTILGGSGEEVIGVLLEEGSATLRGNTITGGSLPITDGWGEGTGEGLAIGVWLAEEYDATLEDNLITGGNSASSFGVQYGEYGQAALYHNTIVGGEGKMVAVGVGPDLEYPGTDSALTLAGNDIRAGSSPYGDAAGVVLVGFSELWNNTISGGDAGSGTCCGISVGIVGVGGFSYIFNNTILGGRAFNSGGETGGVAILSGGEEDPGEAWLVNNIIDPGFPGGVGRSVAVSLDTCQRSITLRNNILYGTGMTHILFDECAEQYVGTINYLNDCSWQSCVAANDNISVDPLLMDLAGGDFHLTPQSPAIDAGTASIYGMEVPNDRDFDPRAFGMDFDIGADEFVPPFTEE